LLVFSELHTQWGWLPRGIFLAAGGQGWLRAARPRPPAGGHGAIGAIRAY